MSEYKKIYINPVPDEMGRFCVCPICKSDIVQHKCECRNDWKIDGFNRGYIVLWDKIPEEEEPVDEPEEEKSENCDCDIIYGPGDDNYGMGSGHSPEEIEKLKKTLDFVKKKEEPETERVYAIPTQEIYTPDDISVYYVCPDCKGDIKKQSDGKFGCKCSTSWISEPSNMAGYYREVPKGEGEGGNDMETDWKKAVEAWPKLKFYDDAIQSFKLNVSDDVNWTSMCNIISSLLKDIGSMFAENKQIIYEKKSKSNSLEVGDDVYVTSQKENSEKLNLIEKLKTENERLKVMVNDKYPFRVRGKEIALDHCDIKITNSVIRSIDTLEESEPHRDEEMERLKNQVRFWEDEYKRLTNLEKNKVKETGEIRGLSLDRKDMDKIFETATQENTTIGPDGIRINDMTFHWNLLDKGIMECTIRALFRKLDSEDNKRVEEIKGLKREVEDLEKRRQRTVHMLDNRMDFKERVVEILDEMYDAIEDEDIYDTGDAMDFIHKFREKYEKLDEVNTAPLHKVLGEFKFLMIEYGMQKDAKLSEDAQQLKRWVNWVYKRIREVCKNPPDKGVREKWIGINNKGDDQDIKKKYENLFNEDKVNLLETMKRALEHNPLSDYKGVLQMLDYNINFYKSKMNKGN